MTRRGRLIWAVGGVLLALLLMWTPLFDRIERSWLDASLRRQAQPRHARDTLVVDIDEASLNQLRADFGDWPLPRELHARVAERLLDDGARAVVFNLLFNDAQPGNDALRALAERTGRIVYGAAALPAFEGLKRVAEFQTGWPDRADIPSFKTDNVLLPSQTLLPAAPQVHVGLMQAPLSGDGLVRCIPLLHRVNGQLMPSLPVAALALNSDRWPPTVGVEAHAVRIGDYRWPTDERGCVQLNLPANADAVPALRYAAFVDAAPDPALAARVNGRTVFIGSPSQMDVQVMTPQGQLGATQWQGLAHAALTAGWWVAPAPGVVSVALIALALVPAALGVRRPRQPIWREAAVAAAVIGALSLLGTLLESRYALSWPLPHALLLVLCGFLAALGSRQLGLLHERERAHAAQRAAEDANRAKTEFLAHVSHEIRTPLNALLGMGQLLAATPLSPLQRHYLDVFASGGRHLQRLIDDTLDLSRIEAGRLALSDDVFALRALIDEVTSLFRPRAQQSRLKFLVDVDARLPEHVGGDAHRLRQVLLNVIGNAFKFTRQGSVRLVVAPAGGADDVEFRVIDTGIGVPADMVDRIFDPFTQADEGVRREYGGSGLGLAITRRLIQAMGGNVGLRSELGRGSEVTLRLPLPARRALAAPAAAVSAASAPDVNDPPPAAWLGRRVLLVEDNLDNVLVARAMLAATGATIDVAHDGADAVRATAATRYDVVLMDVQMPVLDGHAATREIRRQEHETRRPRVPVVAVSANALEADRQASLEAGCDDHLPKPLDKAALLQTLGRFLDRPPMRDLDWAGALDRLGGDRVLYAKVCASAAEHLAPWSAHFDAAMQARDAVACRRLAHDLKSTAGAVGAMTLQQAAARLEDLLRASALDDTAAVDAARAAVLATLEPVRDQLVAVAD